jgi:hypothetical protein
MLSVEHSHDVYGSINNQKIFFLRRFDLSVFRVSFYNTAYTSDHPGQCGQAHWSFCCYTGLNHFCIPNTLIDTENLSVIAARAISVGEELTFFYPSTEWEMARPFICLCKTPGCLGLVAGAKFLPLDVQGVTISTRIFGNFTISLCRSYRKMFKVTRFVATGIA